MVPLRQVSNVLTEGKDRVQCSEAASDKGVLKESYQTGFVPLQSVCHIQWTYMTLTDQGSHSELKERAHLGYGSDSAVKQCDCDTHRLQRQTQSAEVVRLLRQNAIAVTSIANRNTANSATRR